MFCALVNCRSSGYLLSVYELFFDCCPFSSCCACLLVECYQVELLLLLSIVELLSIFKLLHKCLWNAGGKTQVARSRERNLGTKVRRTLAPG